MFVSHLHCHCQPNPRRLSRPKLPNFNSPFLHVDVFCAPLNDHKKKRGRYPTALRPMYYDSPVVALVGAGGDPGFPSNKVCPLALAISVEWFI